MLHTNSTNTNISNITNFINNILDNFVNKTIDFNNNTIHSPNIKDIIRNTTIWLIFIFTFFLIITSLILNKLRNTKNKIQPIQSITEINEI